MAVEQARFDGPISSDAGLKVAVTEHQNEFEICGFCTAHLGSCPCLGTDKEAAPMEAVGTQVQVTLSVDQIDQILEWASDMGVGAGEVLDSEAEIVELLKAARELAEELENEARAQAMEP